MNKLNSFIFIFAGLLVGFAALEVGSYGLLFLCPTFVALGIINLLRKVKRDDDEE